jgi:hypothetical protein
LINITFGGETLDEAKEDFCRIGRGLFNLEISETSAGTAGGNGLDTAEIEPPTPTRRRRGREAAATTPPSEAEDEPLDAGDLRTKVIDLLQQCYRHSKIGAAKVVDLQKQYDVKRFAEVPDAKLAKLYDQAKALWAELNGAAAAPTATDTGPF